MPPRWPTDIGAAWAAGWELGKLKIGGSSPSLSLDFWLLAGHGVWVSMVGNPRDWKLKTGPYKLGSSHWLGGQELKLRK